MLAHSLGSLSVVRWTIRRRVITQRDIHWWNNVSPRLRLSYRGSRREARHPKDLSDLLARETGSSGEVLVIFIFVS